MHKSKDESRNQRRKYCELRVEPCIIRLSAHSDNRTFSYGLTAARGALINPRDTPERTPADGIRSTIGSDQEHS